MRPDADQPATRILLVEDHALVAEAMLSMLTHLGYAPMWAGTLRAAEQAASEEAFAVLIVDYRLPDGTAVEFIRRMPHLRDRVIVLTAYDKTFVRHAREEGVAAYVSKPVDQEKLQEVIEAVRHGRSVPPHARTDTA